MSFAPRSRRRVVPEDEAEEIATAPSAQPVGSAIHEYLSSNGLSRIVRLSAVLKVWDGIMDPDVAAHCHPMRFDGEDLVIEVDHQAWILALRFREAELLGRLGTALGERITGRLKAYVGSDPA